MDAEIKSRQYRPDPELCCQACAFARGEHEPFCPHFRLELATDAAVHAALIRCRMPGCSEGADDLELRLCRVHGGI